MTIEEIYEAFTKGSVGFVRAVQSNCGYGCSDEEVKRIAQRAETAEEFDNLWHNSDFWVDPCSS